MPETKQQKNCKTDETNKIKNNKLNEQKQLLPLANAEADKSFVISTIKEKNDNENNATEKIYTNDEKG